MKSQTEAEKIREALCLFRSMVRSGEKETGQSNQVFESAFASLDAILLRNAADRLELPLEEQERQALARKIADITTTIEGDIHHRGIYEAHYRRAKEAINFIAAIERAPGILVTREQLEGIQWAGMGYEGARECPACAAYDGTEHADDCWIGKGLRSQEKTS